MVSKAQLEQERYNAAWIAKRQDVISYTRARRLTNRWCDYLNEILRGKKQGPVMVTTYEGKKHLHSFLQEHLDEMYREAFLKGYDKGFGVGVANNYRTEEFQRAAINLIG